jgi:hypothetical protein
MVSTFSAIEHSGVEADPGVDKRMAELRIHKKNARLQEEYMKQQIYNVKYAHESTRIMTDHMKSVNLAPLPEDQQEQVDA